MKLSIIQTLYGKDVADFIIEKCKKEIIEAVRVLRLRGKRCLEAGENILEVIEKNDKGNLDELIKMLQGEVKKQYLYIRETERPVSVGSPGRGADEKSCII